jgi:hypothetical protein
MQRTRAVERLLLDHEQMPVTNKQQVAAVEQELEVQNSSG